VSGGDLRSPAPGSGPRPSSPARAGRLRRLAPLLLLPLAVWLGLSVLVAERLVARAEPRGPAPEPPADLPIETLRLHSEDGLELGAWWLPAARSSSVGRQVVVLVHGNGGSRASELGPARVWRGLGADCLLLTVRAHGDSEGERNDIGWSARLDVAAAVAEAERRAPGASILVHGTSLGAAAAVFAAPSLGSRVGAYLLEAPYARLSDAVRRRTALYLPPGLDALAFAGLRLAAAWSLPELDRIRPVEAVAQLPRGAAVWILAGTADRRAPPEDARALAAASAAPVRLEWIEGADHGSIRVRDPGAYAAVLGRVATALGRRP
jgi:alpha-beta hydrolase superfamily lysophospholipase